MFINTKFELQSISLWWYIINTQQKNKASE